MIGWALLAQAPATRPAAESARPAPGQIDQWIDQLAHPRYAVREEATQQLCELDESDLPLLVRRYRAETRFEPKRRIRYVIEFVFHRDQIVGRNGFMGVEVFPQVIAELVDPTTGKLTRGVVVKKVKTGFAAERAGLKDSDVIITLNQQPLPEDPTTASFVQKVSSHSPGTVVTLGVLRASKAVTLRVPVGPDPTRLLSGARTSAMTQDVPAQGLWVADVEDRSPAMAAGLRPNDIIRSVEGAALGPYGPNQIEGILRGLTPGTQIRLEVVRSDVLTLKVKLGYRPPEYIMDPKDLAEARTRFITWWLDQGGDLPDRASEPGTIRVAFGAPPAPRVGPESTLLP